jgi:hypothetical protein
MVIIIEAEERYRKLRCCLIMSEKERVKVDEN